MGLLSQLTNVMKQPADQSPEELQQNFDRAAGTVPRDSLAEGMTHAFQSNQTPPFSEMVGRLFSQANPQQRSGLLSTLLSSVGPGALSSLAGRGGGLANIIGAFQNQGTVTPEHAQQLSPEEVQQLASHAEQHNPSVVNQVGNFFSQHPGLFKTLGTAAIGLVLSKLIRR